RMSMSVTPFRIWTSSRAALYQQAPSPRPVRPPVDFFSQLLWNVRLSRAAPPAGTRQTLICTVRSPPRPVYSQLDAVAPGTIDRRRRDRRFGLAQLLVDGGDRLLLRDQRAGVDRIRDRRGGSLRQREEREQEGNV